jgi:hypothetical protein
MKQSRHALLGLTAGVLLAGSAAIPIHAQVSMTDPDAAVACQAFTRWGGGAWSATAPTMLNFDTGVSLAVRPGETFAPNHTVGGVEVSAVLDRHCGNI